MKRMIIALVAMFMMTFTTASAMSYEQARQQALFLTDKMAYELNLTEALVISTHIALPELDILIDALLEVVTVQEDQLTWHQDHTLGWVALEELVAVEQELNQLAWIRSCRSICKLARVIECDTSLCSVRDDETHLWLLSQSHESLVLRIWIQCTADNVDTLQCVDSLAVLLTLKVYVIEAESFHLWVIEKAENMTVEQMQEEFPAHKAGLHVLITDNEKPYHERKVTLLNGPHTVLSPVTYLSGVNIVRDACEHPVLGKYIHKVQFEELMQTLNLPMDELQKFASDVLERFENPFVDHQVTSIMLNSFPKFETRDLPGVKIYLERKGELPQGLVFGLAAIITYYKGGVREDGAPIQPNDDQKIMDKLTELWATGDTQKVAEGVLGFDYIWHEDLNKTIPGLTELVKKDLDLIQEKGMLEAVKTIL